MQTIPVKELKNKIDNKEEIVILDVRPEHVSKAWKIKPHKNVQLMNIPLQDLNSQLDKIPKNKTIYTLCNRGNSSFMAASQLIQQGYQATNIEGGMKEWSSQFEVKTITKENITIYQFERLGKGCLSYMIISDKESVIIDPSIYTEQYIKLAKDSNATIKYIIDTHLHADHLSGAYELTKQTNATYLCPKQDFKETSISYQELDNKELQINQNCILKSIKTPGHSFGMTSLMLNNKFIFTGDTLFINNIGRPDLSGNKEELASLQFITLQNLLRTLQDSSVILPAHFSQEEERNTNGNISATIGEIKQKNNFLNISNEKEFVEKILSNLPPQPLNYSTIRQINLSNNKPDLEECKELEFGPNNCASSC